MCGIAGFISRETSAENVAPRIRAMVAAMKERGPDSMRAVCWPGKGIALGASRLALVDAAGGHQPVSNEDGSVWVVLNGEIYNHVALRQRLTAAGHRFKTGSDTAVLAHLYEEAGESMFGEIHGMYSIAIHDSRKNEFLLARDHAGMKPLCYTVLADGIAFASDVRALASGGWIEMRKDWEAIEYYFHLGYIPAPFSPFAGVSKLCAGYYLKWREDAHSVIRHWSPPEVDGSIGNDAPVIFENLLGKAVEDHLQGDPEVGCYLSGGWDSSLVAALARPCVSRLRTFSLALPEFPKVDESHHARAVSKLLGTDHETVDFHAARLPGLLMENALKLEEPFNVAPYALLSLIASHASRSVKAVIGGEGADELLAGYPWFTDRRAYQWQSRVPLFLRKWVQARAHGPVQKEFYRKAAVATRNELDFEMIRRLHPGDFPQLGNLPRVLDHRDLGYPRALPLLGVDPTDHLQRRLLLEYGGRLGAILAMGDRVSMAEGLEVRMPFLDRRVVEFAMTLPSRWKIRDGQGKAILKPLIEKHLPVILRRRKQGLWVPEGITSSAVYLDFCRETLSSESALFSKEVVAEAMAGTGRSSQVKREVLATMLHLQLWENAYFARAPARFYDPDVAKEVDFVSPEDARLP